MVGKSTPLSLLVLSTLLLFTTHASPQGGRVLGIGNEMEIAGNILDNILHLYDVPEHGLLSETYPVNPDHKVNYLAEGSVQRQHQEVSFLWPYSGLLSGVVALYANTQEKRYLDLLEERLLPGLEKYRDTTRQPVGYQSYPLFAGHSDRFYDDNVWLALDFCTLYGATQNRKYLDKALEIYEFVYSGWDDNLGGGIYWCEQNRGSKNTCSNAPSAIQNISITLSVVIIGLMFVICLIISYKYTNNLPISQLFL
jgi:uncharacterized protein YyaL (SSP411 family)